MQSSTAIAFRALIMLIFLISVPLLAIFGRDLPEVIKGLLDGRLSVKVTEQPKSAGDTVAPSPSAPANNPFAEAAPYRAVPSPNVSALTDPNSGSSATNAVVPANSVMPAAGLPVGSPSLLAPSASPPGNYTPAAGGSMPSQSAVNTPAVAQSNPAANWPNSQQAPPEAFTAPNDVRPAVPQDPVQSNGSISAASGSDGKFRHIESRLRDLGATHYRLETWGAQNDNYRFECRMAVGGNIGVTQHFEAVEDDPLRAMESVLRQVEDWQRQAAM